MRSTFRGIYKSLRNRKQRRLRKLLEQRRSRLAFVERLEPRVVLNGAPVAIHDPFYSTAQNTALTVTTSDTTLLDNDTDPEGDTITASVVDNPANGTVSNFSSTNGTFTYTPDNGFTGVDTFTYKVNDGTDDGNTVAVQIAVDGNLGPRTNQEEIPLGGMFQTGHLSLTQELTPGVNLVYNSGTLPQPIIVTEVTYLGGGMTPDKIKAQLTFDSSAGTNYEYSTTGLSTDDSLRFALQHDATSLSTGRYDYTVDVVTEAMSGNHTRSIDGSHNVVNRHASTHDFGRGWHLLGLDRLHSETGGMLLERSTGEALWFADKTGGGYEFAEGDTSYSTLVKNGDNTYTLTDKHGFIQEFDTSGYLTSREDRNGLSIDYTYTSGELTKITDEWGRDTTFTYTSGQLTSVSDFASRSATLTYDASGRLDKVTQPDPDGAGSLAAPEWEFDYDATSHQLTKVTNALDDETDYTYGSHDRLTTITHPDNKTISLTSLQTIGLPTGDTGNSLTDGDPEGTITDERSKSSTLKTDRFGNLTEFTDPLDNVTNTDRNAVGLTIKLTEADPDGVGNAARPVTLFGYDDTGNLVYRKNALLNTATWTYTSTFNQVATATDERGREVSYTYDTDGNMTKFTDADDYDITYAYNTDGLVTSITTPDPDGVGSQTAAVTSFSYDTKGRVTTLTNADSTTKTFTYDSADNVTEIVDELSNDTDFTYDTLNRLTSVTYREGGVTEFDYDAMSQRTKVTDPLDNETDYTFNSRGWVTKIERPDPDGAGALTRPESTFTYDGAGNRLTVGLPSITQGGTIDYEYDDAGQMTKQTGPASGAFINYTYDGLGRVTKINDALSHDTEFEYDQVGNRTKVIGHDPDGVGQETGPTTTYFYSSANELIQTTDPRGYHTYFTHNDRGLVTRLQLPDPDGTGEQASLLIDYTYDNVGRLIEQIDSHARKTKYEYDKMDRVTKVTEPDPDWGGSATSPVTTFAYNNAGWQTSVTDPLSRVTSYAYDDEGRVTSITAPDPDGAGSQTAPVTSFVYDAAGNVTSTTDPLSNVTSFEYDDLHRRTKITQPDPDGAGSQTAPVTTFEFNAQGKLSKITDPESRETTFQYDNIGRRTGVTDDDGNQTTTAYNLGDLVTSITTPDPDGVGSQTASVTSFTYDEYNRRTKITDPESGETEFTYDDAGNLLTLTDPENNVTEWAYDGLGRVTIETNELDDARSFYYDGVGRMTRRVDREGRVIQYIYDELDRVTSEEWYTGGTPVPSIAIATTTEGGAVNEVQRVGYTGAMIMGGTFTLSFDGQTTSTISYNASAASVESALEALSNIDAGEVSVTKLQDTGTAQEWQITFQNGLGGTNVAQTTIDTTGVSGMGLSEIEATDTAGGTNDEVQTVTLSNVDDGTFRLAFEGETTAELADDASASAVETALEDLNSVDNVTVTGSAGGPYTVTFIGTHSDEDQDELNGDAANLINGTKGNDITYTLDAAGQLTSVSDDYSDYAYTYDDLGRVLTVDNNNTTGVPRVILTSVYDSNSNRTSLTAEIDSTDDFKNTYTYDNLNRLTQLDQEGQTGGNTVAEKRVDFTYNSVGQYTKIERFNDTDGNSGDEVATSNYTYDTMGRLTGLEYQNGGTDLFTDYSWAYDDMSRITQFVGADGTTDYEYDKTSQLTDADHTYQTDEAYTYDDNGNRTMTGYTTGSNNQLTNDGTYTYTYDDEGNRTSKKHDTTNEETVYEWDFRNRLTKVTEKNSGGTTTQVVEYTYDVFNRRIAKEIDTTSPFTMTDAVIERYVYDDINGVTSVDGGNVVLDFVDPDGDGGTSIALDKRYLYGNAVDQILAQEDVTAGASSADRVYWPLVDHLGTVRDLAKNDGTLGEHYEYDSFGNITSGDTSVTRYLFTSREFDDDTGLQYNRARWYDSEVGRWNTEDPLGFDAGDTNLVRYVGNSTANLVDSSGLAPPICVNPNCVGGRFGPRNPWIPPALQQPPPPRPSTMPPWLQQLGTPPPFVQTVAATNGQMIGPFNVAGQTGLITGRMTVDSHTRRSVPPAKNLLRTGMVNPSLVTQGNNPHNPALMGPFISLQTAAQNTAQYWLAYRMRTSVSVGSPTRRRQQIAPPNSYLNTWVQDSALTPTTEPLQGLGMFGANYVDQPGIAADSVYAFLQDPTLNLYVTSVYVIYVVQPIPDEGIDPMPLDTFTFEINVAVSATGSSGTVSVNPNPTVPIPQTVPPPDAINPDGLSLDF